MPVDGAVAAGVVKVVRGVCGWAVWAVVGGVDALGARAGYWGGLPHVVQMVPVLSAGGWLRIIRFRAPVSTSSLSQIDS